MFPLLIKDKNRRVIELALGIGGNHAHDNTGRHDADKCIIACECSFHHICQTRKIYCFISFRNVAAQAFRDMNYGTAVHCICKTDSKLYTSGGQGKECCSHCFASRNICENPGAYSCESS